MQDHHFSGAILHYLSIFKGTISENSFGICIAIRYPAPVIHVPQHHLEQLRQNQAKIRSANLAIFREFRSANLVILRQNQAKIRSAENDQIQANARMRSRSNVIKAENH